MDTLKAIKERKSIRSFKKDKISKKIIEDIINCGRLAPSAKNRQPWSFVIVQNEVKDAIADMMLSYDFNISKERNIKYKISLKNTAKVIKQAPILVLIFKVKDDEWIIGDNLSIGACVENMCLRATELEIGSLWIRDTVYVAPDIAKLLNKNDMELNCALALGYIDKYPNPRIKKSLYDIMEWYD